MAPEFSVREIPFSRSGAWFGLSPVVGSAVYAKHLHVVSHRNGMNPVLSLVPVTDDYEVGASPETVRWQADGGQITAVFSATDTLRIRGSGLGLRIAAAQPTLTPFSGTYFFTDPTGGAVFTSYETGHRFRLTLLSGIWACVGAQQLGTADRAVVVGADGGPWEVAIEELATARPPYRPGTTFDHDVAAVRTAFNRFADTVAPWRTERTPAAELACYVLWSATVAPSGFVTRPTVLMSKHWMDKVWSWDHCFNALSLAAGAPELCWDQFQVVFDHQDTHGALPDSITHSEVLRNFVKPPIHGWTLSRLRERLPQGLPDTATAYRRLVLWTRFWLDHRRAPGRHLPHYEHGNDSGWDNATVFAEERLVQSADLAAFLVLQMKELAALATDLGDTSARWAEQADDMLNAMLTELWDGHRFTSRGALTDVQRTSESLLDLMPLVLGEHLPRHIFDELCSGVEQHLTHIGLATELPTSPHYEADGYWRGPVWAPATVLLEDGLRRGGAVELADRISTRFRDTCEKSGFAENFDALTGEGLRDRAYTWTAAAYLILAEDAERRAKSNIRRDAGPGEDSPGR
ncbi:MAG: trehalase family glycosidase [Kibdelosporangium sp.]